MADEVAHLSGYRSRLDELDAQVAALQTGGGGGTYGPMEGRVTKLETHMEYMQRDMSEIKGDLKTLVQSVQELPTKKDLWAWKWQWTALAFAMIAIVIGGIIGGLAWIQPEPSAPVPIVIQQPAGAASPDN